MKHTFLSLIGMAALGVACSQAPPPKVAPTAQASPSPQDSADATPDVPLEESLASPATTPKPLSPRVELAQLREKAQLLEVTLKMQKQQLEAMERDKDASPEAIDKELYSYLRVSKSHSVLRQEIIALEARFPGAKIPSEQHKGLAEISQRETEEKILTLTALVTELQVDYYGKQALYDALKNDPNSSKKVLRAARKNYRECAEQLWTIKETLAEAKEEQRVRDRIEAERRKRTATQRAKENSNTP